MKRIIFVTVLIIASLLGPEPALAQVSTQLNVTVVVQNSIITDLHADPEILVIKSSPRELVFAQKFYLSSNSDIFLNFLRERLGKPEDLDVEVSVESIHGDHEPIPGSNNVSGGGTLNYKDGVYFYFNDSKGESIYMPLKFRLTSKVDQNWNLNQLPFRFLVGVIVP